MRMEISGSGQVRKEVRMEDCVWVLKAQFNFVFHYSTSTVTHIQCDTAASCSDAYLLRY